jgi:predicted nucleic acid-binding Zn ribbon protein
MPESPAEGPGAESLPGDGAGDQAAADAASAALRRATRSTSPARRKQAGPRRTGSQYSDARDPQPLSQALERLVEDQGWQDQSAVAVLMGEWEQIVGRDIAEHVRPVSFSDGELGLEAESTAWATQVRLLAATLVARLNADLGQGTVTRVTVLGPDGPSWKKGKLRVKGRGPRDTYG